MVLCDLDHSSKIGDDIEVYGEPLGRRLTKEENEAGAGSFGKASAQADIFAIGSVYYTLLRGHEPYELESWGEEHGVIVMERFQKKEFPSLSESCADAVIRKCWNGAYQSMRELLMEFDGNGPQAESTSEDREWLELRRQECETFVRSGLMNTLGRY